MDALRGQIVAHAMFSELEKIARSAPSALLGAASKAITDPSELAHAFQSLESLRGAANPDLLQKLRPGTGSLFEAIGDRARNFMASRNARRGAVAQLGAMRPPMSGFKNQLEEADSLRRMGAIRDAERSIHGPGLFNRAPTQAPGFFQQAQGVAAGAGRNTSLRNVAFGAGAGAAGLLAAQHYMSQPQQDMAY